MTRGRRRSHPLPRPRRGPAARVLTSLVRLFTTLTAGTAAVLAAAAGVTWWGARRAAAERPPAGRFAAVGGVRLHYVTMGSGPTVVLLHGNPGTTDDLRPLASLLAARHRVVLVDRPGHGFSDRGGLVEATPSRQAELLHALLSTLSAGRPVLVGHSWGGALALAYASRYPQDVAGLVLAAPRAFPSAGPPDPLYALLRRRVVGAALRYTVAPAAARGALERRVRSAYAPAPADTAHVRRARRLWLRPGQLGATVWDTELLQRELPGLVARYPQLDVPTVLVAGARDPMLGETRRLHDHLPVDTLVVVPDAGHYLPRTHPGAVVGAVSLVDDARPVTATSPPPAPNGRPARRPSTERGAAARAPR